MADADDSVRVVLDRMLRVLGYGAWAFDPTAPAGARARAGAPFDFAIVDVSPGSGDGPALIDELRRRQPRLPVVRMGGPLEREAARASNPAEIFLLKPFGFREFADAVFRTVAGLSGREGGGGAEYLRNLVS
ncbi:MAG: hypothetical protein HYX53_06820 [Chloroflexi bacterium]|nr:hypothetical protein [Chloroflexota bacterium]